MEPILVEATCIRATAADDQYFEEGRTYTIDMVWAKKRDVWRYFRPLREISVEQAEERVHDEILPDQERIDRARAEANEEAEAKIEEKKPEPVKSYAPVSPQPGSKSPTPDHNSKPKPRVLGSQIGRKAK